MLFFPVLLFGEDLLPEKAYELLRKEARERKRRVIFNNDGCDILYYPRSLKADRENFLALRTSFLAGACDTLMYCPVSAGQGHFTLPLRGADFLTADPLRKESRNIAGILSRQKQDYFQWLIDFCRKNKMEIFFSFRFNDTHDVRHRPEKPYFLFSPYKDKNRHLLFGKDHEHNPRFGWWSSLDFSQKAVRDRQIALVKAVLEKYDVDGIDLDFSRYLKIFPRTANGMRASEKETALMTQLLRDIRREIDLAGRRKKKAILLSVVLPDDQQLCRNLGYDIQTFFKEGLVDLWQQHDGFQLNSIRENVRFAHRYGVKYYAFSGRPYPYYKLEKGSVLDRSLPSAYAGKINNAVYGGADGLYLYNISSASEFKRAAGIPEERASYFVTNFSWEIPRGYSFSPEDYGKYSQLNAHVKCTVSPGGSKTFPLEINRLPEKRSQITCYVDRQMGEAGNLKVELNKTALKFLETAGRYECFAVPSELLKSGMNEVTVSSLSDRGKKLILFSPEKEKDFELNFFGLSNVRSIRKAGEKTFAVSAEKGIAGLVKRFGNWEFEILCFEFTVENPCRQAWIRLANSGYALEMLLDHRKLKVNQQKEILLPPSKNYTFQVVMRGNTSRVSINGNVLNKTFTNQDGYSSGANVYIPVSARLYGSSSSLILGALKGGEAVYKSVTVSNPPGSVQISNLMIDCETPKKKAWTQEGKWRSAAGNTGRRILDGRALPFGVAPGKKAMAGEIEISPGNRRSIWVFSDGSQVIAWIITRECVMVWPGTKVSPALNWQGKKEVWQTRFSDGQAELFRNGRFFYRTGRADPVSYDRKSGLTLSRPEVLPPEIFLKNYSRNFTAKERQIIQKGGTFLRGLRQNPSVVPGELFNLKLAEKKVK